MSIAPPPSEPPPPQPQPAGSPPEPKPDRRVGQAYLLLAISACLLLSIGVPAQLWSPYVGLTITETLLIFVPAVLYVYFKRLPIAAALRWRPISPASALASVAIGVTGCGLAHVIVYLSTPFLGRPPEIDFFEFDTLPQLALTLFCAALLPGVCEETLFRGAIQGTLERLGPAKAILITSVLFALFHLNPWNFLPPFFLGVVFGVMTLRAGSTIPTMIAHAATNATSFTLAYLYHDEFDPRAKIVIVVLAVAFVVVFSLYLMKTRHQAPGLGPLASVPAGLSWRAIAASAAGMAVYVALVVVVAFALLSGRGVTGDDQVPGLDSGDRVLLLKWPLAQIGLSPGDVVAFDQDDRSELGRVKRCDATHVWLFGQPISEPLERRQITGRAIHIDRPSE